MGTGWAIVAFLAFGFMWAFSSFRKRLSDGHRQRQRSMQDWIDGDDE